METARNFTASAWSNSCDAQAFTEVHLRKHIILLTIWAFIGLTGVGRAQEPGRMGNDVRPKSVPQAPEISVEGGLNGLALLIGSLVVMRGRRKRLS